MANTKDSLLLGSMTASEPMTDPVLRGSFFVFLTVFGQGGGGMMGAEEGGIEA